MKYLIGAIAAGVVIALNGSTAQATSHPTHWRHAARVCATSTMLADDYAHTGVKPDGYHRAIVACVQAVGGF